MSRKLRIFLSSTMKDLANERDLVVRRLREFNFEPLNAEAWNPTGGTSWTVIREQIESSDIFLLLLGDRYGWIPDRGPMAGKGQSITHLEFLEARSLGLPVLAFLKELDYGADRTSPDAQARDKFRQEVGDWEGGYFITDFELASDLVEKVSSAVIGLLSDRFLRAKISERAEASAMAEGLSYSVPLRGIQRDGGLPLPSALVKAVSRREAFLFAGSGISLAAGLPSGVAFAEAMIQAVRQSDPTYAMSPVGSGLAAIAYDLEATQGRQSVLDVTRDLLDPPQGLQPTDAHLHAVGLFDRIVTTNFDQLFEDAARRRDLQPTVVLGEPEDATLPPPTIVKLHGSAEQPESLVITEREVLLFDRTHPRLWSAVRDLLRSKPVVVVGSSLRDPSIVRLFEEAGEGVSGYFVGPSLSAVAPARLRSWNLECIEADADGFFESLARAVER